MPGRKAVLIVISWYKFNWKWNRLKNEKLAVASFVLERWLHVCDKNSQSSPDQKSVSPSIQLYSGQQQADRLLLQRAIQGQSKCTMMLIQHTAAASTYLWFGNFPIQRILKALLVHFSTNNLTSWPLMRKLLIFTVSWRKTFRGVITHYMKKCLLLFFWTRHLIISCNTLSLLKDDEQFFPVHSLHITC